MNTKTIGRSAVRGLAVVLLSSAAAIGFAGCQTTTAPPVPVPVAPSVPRPFDRTLIEKFGGRPADRVAEEIERAIEDEELSSPDCISHRVVEHPDGGYHLVCVVARE